MKNGAPATCSPLLRRGPRAPPHFRGLTPGRTWEASDARSVVDNVLKSWFEPSDELERLVSTQTDAFADRARVGYRLEGHNPDGPFVVEQQAYYEERDGRIGWMRVVCSGFRPRGG